MSTATYPPGEFHATYDAPAVPALVTVYRNDAGEVYALRLDAGLEDFTITRKTGSLGPRWVVTGGYAPERDVTRYYCPGHNGHVCFYGACDEVRYAGPMPEVPAEHGQ